MDSLYQGIMYSMTKNAFIAPLLTGSAKLLTKGVAGAVKKAPGTTIGAPFALYGAGSAASGLASPTSKSLLRSNLNKAFPQGQPGKMLGGF